MQRTEEIKNEMALKSTTMSNVSNYSIPQEDQSDKGEKQQQEPVNDQRQN